MKAQTKKLIETLKTMKKIAQKSRTMPILSNLAILTDDLGIQFQATDLEITATQNVLVSQDFKKATYLISPSDLIDFLSASESLETTFQQLERELLIKTDGMTKSVFLDNDESWPLVDKDLKIDYTLSLTGLSEVSKAMSDDEARYHLNGVYFDSTNGAMVATDGHRLHKQAFDSILTPLDSFIMPKSAVKLLEDQSEIKVSRLTDGFLLAQLDNGLKLYIKALEGRYPNWQQFIPTKFKHSIKGNCEAFVKVLKKASKLADKKSRSIAFDENKLTCSSDMSIELKGIENKAPKIGFNCDYLQDAISCIDAEDIILDVNDSLSPALIKNKSFTAVILPMRV